MRGFCERARKEGGVSENGVAKAGSIAVGGRFAHPERSVGRVLRAHGVVREIGRWT